MGKSTKREYILKTPSLLQSDLDQTTGPGLYTALQVAKFHGLLRKKGKDGIQPSHGFEGAWDALVLIEEGIVTTEQFRPLKSERVRSLF